MRKEFKAIEQCSEILKGLTLGERERVFSFISNEHYEQAREEERKMFAPAEPLTNTLAETKTEDAPQEPVKKGSAKKAKAKTEAKKEEVQETSKEEDAPKYTKKDITDACQKVSMEKSLTAAKEILEKFGAARISEVKTEDYGAFIEACEDALENE